MPKLKISPPPFPNREEYPFTASVRYRGMVIDIENLDGSVREGTDSNGKSWRTPFKGCHYGELRGSLGTDGDKLDVYIKSNPDNGANRAYIVHQNFPRTHPTKGGQYDEDKVVLGVSSLEAAKELYLRHYNRKDFLRSVTEMPIEKFKKAAFKENKGEKVARYITESELRQYGTDPEKIKRAAKNLVDRNGKPLGSAFIRTKMREGGAPMNIEKIKEAACKAKAGEGRGHGPTGKPLKDKGMTGKEIDMSKKSEVTEAYKMGAQVALDEYLKEAAQKGFQTVLKKLPGSPAVRGAIPAPPKVSSMGMASVSKIAIDVFNPPKGSGVAPLMSRGAPQQMQTQAFAGPASTPTALQRASGQNIADAKTMTYPASTGQQQQEAVKVPAVTKETKPMVASVGGAGGVPKIPTGG